MYGAGIYGSLVFGAGLVVTSLTPVPPAGEGNGYGASGPYGTGVYGAGQVVTATAPVLPEGSTAGNGYGTCIYGAHVYGAGCVVTSAVPVGPASARRPSFANDDVDVTTPLSKRTRQRQQIEAVIIAFLNLQR